MTVVGANAIGRLNVATTETWMKNVGSNAAGPEAIAV
jgi:hypothetical protein